MSGRGKPAGKRTAETNVQGNKEKRHKSEDHDVPELALEQTKDKNRRGRQLIGEEAMSRMASVVRKIIKTAKAPGAVGPYSQAVLVNHTLYLSGQIGLDVNTGTIVPGGVVAEAEQVLRNMGVVLAEAGSDYSKVVKCTVLLDDIANFNAVNEVYLKFFTTDKLPARACYAVKDLPRGAKIEIEAVAIVGDVKDE